MRSQHSNKGHFLAKKTSILQRTTMVFILQKKRKEILTFTLDDKIGN